MHDGPSIRAQVGADLRSNETRNRRLRIQHHTKNGKSVKEIAQQEGLSERQVLRYTSGPVFQRNLARHRMLEAVRDLNLAQRMKKIVEVQIGKVEADTGRMMKVMDITKLNQAARVREERAETVLAAQIQKGEETSDPELRAAHEYLKAKRLAKQAVLTGAHAEQLMDHAQEKTP